MSANRFRFRAWDGKQMLAVEDDFILRDTRVHEWIENDYDNYMKDRSDDCILMQSTGLTDRNGVEIFEGDICKITYDISSPNADKAQYCKATAIISYDDERLCWFWSVCDRYKTVIDIDEYEVTTIVIIGNVHQPELMEQK